MQSVAHVLIVLMALVVSAMAVAAQWTTPKQHPSGQNLFEVTHFGAIGDGRNDDSKAFESAWAAACKAAGSDNRTIIVPNKTFLVSPVIFRGPCNSHTIVFLVLGKIVAPPKGAWKGNSVQAWLRFSKVDGLVVDGNKRGTIDGRGETWWQKGVYEESSRPTALEFTNCNNLQVRGLNHVNSQRNHLSVSGSRKADLSDLHMTAPADSPNTDGIDISNSDNINIHNSVVATGDDCIAIKPGTSNIKISDIQCGPGHGISVGSLGKGGDRDEVQGLIVTRCAFRGSDNGVRIKTWQGGSGFAKNIIFSDIVFDEVKNPIVIDQNYCPHKTCSVKPSAVKISDVKYSGLRGTTVSKFGIDFNCSKTVPCTDIELENVDIRSANGGGPAWVHCSNAQGSALGLTRGMNCLTKRISH